MTQIRKIDITSSQFKANPFPILAQLRHTEPVYRATLPDKTAVWLVTRYADVHSLLRDGRFAKSRYRAMTPEQLRKQPWVPPMFRPLERTMLDLDPPDHTRLRTLVHKAFTPRVIEQMRSRVQTLANELLRNTALHNQQLLVLLVVVAASAAVTLRWRLFRPFWAHIRQDWTYLSYGLFAIIMLLTGAANLITSRR